MEQKVGFSFLISEEPNTVDCTEIGFVTVWAKYYNVLKWALLG